MIVPSMTVQEIHSELLEDIERIFSKISFHKKDFGRKVLKASRYPFTYSYDCITPKKNLIVVRFTVLKRSQWENPILGFCGVYNRPEGKYAIALSIETNYANIYPPHFFKRYRQRIVKDNSLSNDAIISRYFKNECGLVQAVVDENFEAVFRNYEIIDKDEKVGFIGALEEGYCFGEKQGSINIVKTIISEEELFDDQKSLFAELRLSYEARKNVFFKQ